MYYETYRKHQKQQFGTQNERTKENADRFFQIQEHKGELWLSFNGCPVMPTSFLKEDPLIALKKSVNCMYKSVWTFNAK